MAKKSTTAVAPPGWEVEPPPAMQEGYIWCPECQAAFKGNPNAELAEVCPGCSPSMTPEEAPEADKTTLTVDGGEPKTLEDLAAELNVKTRNTTESLKCILTDDEKLRYGIAQARANAEIATAEEELQAVKSQYKSRVDAATANRNDMAKRINNGYEFRQVECTERWDYGGNIITVIRTDTWETVSRRTMTRDETQGKLF